MRDNLLIVFKLRRTEILFSGFFLVDFLFAVKFFEHVVILFEDHGVLLRHESIDNDDRKPAGDETGEDLIHIFSQSQSVPCDHDSCADNKASPNGYL